MGIDRPPSQQRVSAFLAEHHGAPIEDLEPLSGGFWSSAFSYRVGDRELVLRLGADDGGFRMDHAAGAFSRPGLPIPEVLDVGEAFGGAYAISVRHHGRFLEDVDPSEGAVVGPALARLLEALRAASPQGSDGVNWVPGSPSGGSWRDWLLAGLVDDPRRTVSGWRSRLAELPHTNSIFEAAVAEVHRLLARCPERRDLVHGDLLHRNVLVSPDGTKVNAVFSWKCSVLGDFLYDVAWCTFWGAWHPGIASADAWGRTVRSVTDPADGLLTDAEHRHRCYQLHIGATHLAWNAWTGNDDELLAVTGALEHLLESTDNDQRTSP